MEPIEYDPGEDPVASDKYPHITEYDPRHDPTWPEQWGSKPTPRDQAAMVARARAAGDDIADDDIAQQGGLS